MPPIFFPHNTDSRWVALFNLSERDFRLASNEIWIDFLPLEVCIRIAKHLVKSCYFPHVTRYVSPLQLAETSPRQRLAIWQALDRQMGLEGDDDFAIRLAGLFRDNMKSLTCSKWHGPQDIITQLLSVPSLVHVDMPYSLHYFRELSAVKLKSLSINFNSRYSEKVFIYLVPIQTLVEFHLTLAINVERNDAQLGKEIVRCFPNLQTLTLRFASPKLYLSTSLRESLQRLSKLKAFTFDFYVSLEDTHFLKSLQHVCFRAVSFLPIVELPHKDVLQENVFTGIDFCSNGVSRYIRGIRADACENLSHCLRLVQLQIPVQPGDEVNIPKLPQLQSLCIWWIRPRNTVQPAAAEPIYQLPSASLGHILDISPTLKELQLYNVQISCEDVQWLLESVGEQLERFAVSAMKASGAQVQFVTCVMDTVVRCNRSLKWLKFDIKSDGALCDDPTVQEWRRSVWKSFAVLERVGSIGNVEELRNDFDTWLKVTKT